MGIFCTRKLRRCKKKWAMKSPYRTSQVPQPTFGSGSGNLGTIGHAAAIKWGHVALWTCLAAWLSLPTHFLQGPLPCRVYNLCAKMSLLCTKAPPSKAMRSKFLWQLMCVCETSLCSENASVSLWPYPMPAIILFAVYENMLSMQCLFSVYLRGQRNTFEGFKPRLPSASM